MSSTRHATDGSLHQERWCSAPEFEKGPLANIVAKRCEMLRRPEDRQFIWSLQYLLHQMKSEELSASVLERYPEQIGTPTMRETGIAAEASYTLSQAARICEEITSAGGASPFIELVKHAQRRERLAAQAARAKRLQALIGAEDNSDRGQRADPPRKADAFCCSDVVNWTEVKTRTLPRELVRLCMEPTSDLDHCRPWYFPALVACLRQYIRDWIKSQCKALVPTALSREVHAALDFVLEVGGMTVLEGPPARVGKSFACRTFCETHPDRARYVQVPATNDDIGFYRSIAEAIGSASALSMKGVQLRERVEKTLQSSKLMLVLDNAEYLWPQNNRREALPNRLNWLLTALVNRGVAIALATNPQFGRDQQIVEAKTGWTSAQFLNQVIYKKLPDGLSTAELEGIAAHWLPEADPESIQALANCGQLSGRFLGDIETAVKRARFIASSAGRDKVQAGDVREAIAKYVLPSFRAMTAALGPKEKSHRTRGTTPPVHQRDAGAERDRTAAEFALVGGSRWAPHVEDRRTDMIKSQ
jgi:hypothetical protein